MSLKKSYFSSKTCSNENLASLLTSARANSLRFAESVTKSVSFSKMGILVSSTVCVLKMLILINLLVN